MGLGLECFFLSSCSLGLLNLVERCPPRPTLDEETYDSIEGGRFRMFLSTETIIVSDWSFIRIKCAWFQKLQVIRFVLKRENLIYSTSATLATLAFTLLTFYLPTQLHQHPQVSLPSTKAHPPKEASQDAQQKPKLTTTPRITSAGLSRG